MTKPRDARRESAASVLFADRKGRVLIVRPRYRRDCWLFPGGTVEHGEQPRAGAVREIKEELGLDVKLGRCLCVDSTIRPDGKGLVVFVFDGGVLTDEQIAKITIPESELRGYEFVTLAEARRRLGFYARDRLPYVLKAKRANATAYLENERPVL